MIDGPLQLNTADGYHMTARDARFDLKKRQMESRASVDGRLPMGTFSADRLHADLSTQTVSLDGHVHLHLDPRSAKGWKP
jgi:lipopolysaccharide export system protein LptC